MSSHAVVKRWRSPLRLNEVMVYLEAENELLGDLLRRFGAELRRCRHHAGLSQMTLAALSGVPQSTISRMERGMAARVPLLKIVLLSEALGLRLPMAYCPHDHQCAWRRLDSNGRPAKPSAVLDQDSWLREMGFVPQEGAMR